MSNAVPTDKIEQPLYWPEPMLAEIRDHATRTGHSMSYIVQFAWKQAGEQIAARDEDSVRGVVRGLGTGEKRKQALYFPRGMLDAMTAQAARIDASLSLIAQAAFVLAKPAIEALPTVGDQPA